MKAKFLFYFLPFLANAALVDSGLSYIDAADNDLVSNLPRGSISGGWNTAKNDGTTPILSPTGYSTPLWQIAAFSGGNDYGNQGKKNGVSQVGGKDIPINDQTLDAWRAMLDNVRANGALVTPRFAYDFNGVSGCEPGLDMVLTHINQICSVLNDYADVVVSVECGIIGMFGEMHSSKYDDANNIQYDTTIVRTWLNELDPRIKLQIRSPKYLFRLYQREVRGTTGTLRGTEVLEHLKEIKDWDRIGLYNDGYLGTTYDYGTFTDSNGINNFSRAQANAWLKQLPDIPYGGEIATLTTDEQEQTWPPFVQPGFNQVAEWYDCHLSYLRGTPITMRVVRKMNEYVFTPGDYAFDGMPNLSEWSGKTLLDLMRSHMGYRFVLRSSKLSDTTAPGGTLQLAFDIENTGFGDLFMPTATEVLLQAESDRFWACPVSIDIGKAVPSPKKSSLSLSLRLPSAITNGKWRVYLRTHIVTDADSPSAAGLRTIRFANPQSQWNAALGANLLGTVTISGSASAANLDFRETGSSAAGATAPQIPLDSIPSSAAVSVPLSEWEGRELCLFAPGAAHIRYFHAGVEVPSENGVVQIPEGNDALGLWSVRYEHSGASLSRDVIVIVPDGWEGRTWSLETRSGRLRAVCAETNEETDPAPGYDRRLPGRAMEGDLEKNAKLVFAGTDLEFTAETPSSALYPAFVVAGIPEGGAKLGGLRTVTANSGGGSFLDSNSSGNLADRSSNPTGAAKQTVDIPNDGAYLTDIGFTLVNWVSPFTFGTARSFALNDPSASRGGVSSNLENANLATLGLFYSDPGYHVWFCDGQWNVLQEKSGSLAAGYKGNFHSIPIPAATNLWTGTQPAAASTLQYCRPFEGWKNLDGTQPSWALGDIALVASYAETEHEWEGYVDSETGAERLRCKVCGFETDGTFERTWHLETRSGQLLAVCDQTDEVSDPAPGYERGISGRLYSGDTASDGKLVFAGGTVGDFTSDTPTTVLYPAFLVSGLSASGGALGSWRATVYADGYSEANTIDSNNSGNMNSFKAFALPEDGAYMVGVTYPLFSWVGSKFGTARTLSANDTSATRGEGSSGLEGATLTAIGLFSSDPGYHVWFCDEDWTVLAEKTGSIAGSVGWLQSSAAFPIPRAASLYDAEIPFRDGTDQLCHPLKEWLELDGTPSNLALGNVALVASYGDAPHDWEFTRNSDASGGTLRCRVCGHERTVSRPKFVVGETESSLRIDATVKPPQMRIGIANAIAGAYYTVFVAESLNGPWRAASESIRAKADSVLELSVEASTPAKFARVVLSGDAFAQGAAMPK